MQRKRDETLPKKLKTRDKRAIIHLGQKLDHPSSAAISTLPSQNIALVTGRGTQNVGKEMSSSAAATAEHQYR